MRGLRGLVRVAGVLIAALAVALCVATLVDQWSVVGPAVAGADVRWLLPAFVAAAAAMTGLAALWWRCLLLYGVQVPASSAVAWYFGGELGKYVPGGVWVVVGRGELARRGGVDRARGYTTTLLSLAVMCVGAGVVCGVLAPFADSSAAGRSAGLGWGWVVIALVPLGVLGVHPAIIGPAWSVLDRLSRGRVRLGARPWGQMLALISWAVPVWVFVGAVSVSVTAALDYAQSPARVAFAAVVAWVLGFLVVPVPAGAGIRELLFVLLSGLPMGPAIAVAALARLLFVVVDAVGGISGLSWARRTTVAVAEPALAGPEGGERR